MWTFSAAWSRYFAAGPNPSATARQFRRSQRPTPSHPWAWRVLFSRLPEDQHDRLAADLERVLRQRQEQPPAEPAEAVSRERFGLCGEELTRLSTPELRRQLRREWRATLHTLEEPAGQLSRTTRNWWLVMHCARLGQLYRELAQPWRGLWPGEEMRHALAACASSCH